MLGLRRGFDRETEGIKAQCAQTRADSLSNAFCNYNIVSTCLIQGQKFKAFGYSTVKCVPLHLIVSLVGVDFEQKIPLWVRYHLDLVLVIDEIAVARISMLETEHCLGIFHNEHIVPELLQICGEHGLLWEVFPLEDEHDAVTCCSNDLNKGSKMARVEDESKNIERREEFRKVWHRLRERKVQGKENVGECESMVH